MKISVCMCTYKRTHLKNTLKSVFQLKRRPEWDVEIIVVDNDAELSGKLIVDNFNDEFGTSVIYASEPAKNIAAARNKLLELASGQWVAFIDDDEVADSGWLLNLLITAEKYNADVVFGRVVSIYPANTPRWILAGRYFDRPERLTGEIRETGGTGSTLVKRLWNSDKGYWFDLSFGLTGGEDSDLFYRMGKAGAVQVWCNEAFVSEEIEQTRLNASYLIKRSFRVGQTYVRYRSSYWSGSELLKFFSKVFIKIILSSLALLFHLPLGRNRYFSDLESIVDAWGKITALFSSKAMEIYDR